MQQVINRDMLAQETIKSDIARRLLLQLLGHIGIYGAALLFFFGIGYIWGHSRIWYPETSEYWFYRSVEENWLAIFLFCLLVGCLFITGIHIFRFAKILSEITGAVHDIVRQNASYIKLPVQLHEIETQLNHILAQMQKDRKIAQEAEQRKNDIIVYLAHDLKTPLTSVIGYLNLLCDEKDVSDTLREKYLSIALKKAERLEELINEFFEVTKYNFTATTLTLSQVNFSMMLTQMIAEFESLFREKGVTCRMDIPENLHLTCDVEKMERVFDNIFKNVYNYCYENTSVFISLQAVSEDAFSAKPALSDGKPRMEQKDVTRRDGQLIQKSQLMVTVTNSGKTIPKEKLAHLFDQFFRIDPARGSKTGGTGLGLAIAKEIIMLHNGSITCDSNNETITFTICLPAGQYPIPTDL